MSKAAREAVEVPAYEDRALRGQCSPKRFRWRGRWYRVVEVCASWRDGRNPVPGRPDYGRTYFNVTVEPEGLFQLCYKPSASGKRGRGRWLLYRSTEMRILHK